MHRVLIVGGGFGGVKAAQELSKCKDVEVRLVDPKSYMEYHAAMYRMVTGRSPMEVCLPYTDLFEGMNVDVQKDSIQTLDFDSKIATGASGSRYSFDSIILAVGSQPAYFGIPGIEEHAHSMQSACSAAALRYQLQELFTAVKSAKPQENTSLFRIAVVGAGATGVELAGELAWYVRDLARKNAVDPSLVTVDLIEAAPRVLPSLSERTSTKALHQLRKLGVHVYVNRSLEREEEGQIILNDMQIQAKTVVWTAGVKAHTLLSSLGFETDKRGRVVVDEHLHVKDKPTVYVIGDGASTKFSGMAQTALRDAVHVAAVISATLQGTLIPHYTSKTPAYAVPVGPKWAAFCFAGWCVFGRLGWMLRRLLDLYVFLSLLPFAKAMKAFRSTNQTEELTKSCPIR